MPAPETARTLTVVDLAELCAELRSQGFKVAVQQAIWAQQVLTQLESSGQWPDDPRQLTALLGPIFCSKPEEQRRFSSFFSEWVKPLPPPPPPPPPPPRSDWRRWIGHGVAAIILIAVVWWRWNEDRARTLRGVVVVKEPSPGSVNLRLGKLPITVLADGRFSFQYHKKDLPLWLQASRAGYETRRMQLTNTSLAELRLELQPLRGLAPTNPVTPDSARNLGVVHWPNPTAELATVATLTPPRKSQWVRPALAAAPLGLLLGIGSVRWIVLRRKQPVLERRRATTPESLAEVKIPGGAREFLAGFEFRLLARELRRRRLVDSTELDVPATLQSTLRNGGLFTPVYGSRLEPDYLVLVDRASFADHQARLAEEIVQALVHSDISIEQFEFNLTPDFCRRVDTRASALGPLVGLDELRARFPEHRVLVFSDGGGFFDPFSGERAAWLSVFESWTDRAVLTPEPPERWSRREWAIEKLGVRLLPLSRQGFTLLADSFRERPESALAGNAASAQPAPEFLRQGDRWLDRYPPDERVQAELRAALQQHLGPAGFLWLAACAAYPGIHWGLTLRFGHNLIAAEVSAEAFEALLPRLTRLPWLRHGYMPDWVRAMLLDGLKPADAERIHKLLEQILAEAEKAEKKGADGVPLKIATDSADTGSRVAANRLKDDFVFITYLSGRQAGALRLSVPERLRALLSPRPGYWTWWLGGLVALALAGALALYVFAPLSPAPRGACRSLALSADGETLAAGYNDGSLIFWERSPDGLSYEPTVAEASHNGPVLATAITADGALVVTGGEDGEIKIWERHRLMDRMTGKHEATFDLRGLHGHTVTSLAFMPNGKEYVSASEGKTVRLDPLTGPEFMGKVVGRATDALRALAVHPSGSILACGGDEGVVQLWTTNGDDYTKPIAAGSPVRALAFSPRDNTLAAGCLSGTVVLLDWRADSRRWTAPSNHRTAVWSVAFSRSGELLASVSLEGSVLVWDAASGRPLYQHVKPAAQPDGFYWAVAFTPDSRQLVLAGADGNVELVELDASKPLPYVPVATNAPPPNASPEQKPQEQKRPSPPSNLKVAN